MPFIVIRERQRCNPLFRSNMFVILSIWCFFFSSRRRHTRCLSDWSSDVCSSDLLGLFDYLPDPQRFSRRMFELCARGGCLVGSFPKWSLLKGPIRKIRYEWIGDCPIFNYQRRELELMLGASGFERVQVREGRHGHLARAYLSSASPSRSTGPGPALDRRAPAA